MSEDQPTVARLTVEREPPVARLTLSHGQQNVIDIQMMDELTKAFEDLEYRSEVSTIVISTGGEHFSAGVDIPSHTPDKVGVMLEKFHAAIRRLWKTPKVTIAAVKGYCLGGGAELAMACDIVITTDGARWGFPEIKLGCYPPVAAAALSAVVGQKLAADLVLTGRSFDGREAERIGLASRAVPADKLKQTISEYVEYLVALSPVALAHAKRALYTWDAAHAEKGLARAEDIYLKELIHTEDAKEGIRAWIEKRKPKWQGR
jgi:cyclohexa-1,5-dienecarbonyl-CoA hydratase